MAIEKQTRLYEVLVRVTDAGTWAAHYQNITIFSENGTILNAVIGPATKVNPEDAQAFSILSDLLGQSAADTLVAAQTLSIQVQELQYQLALAAEEISRLTAPSTPDNQEGVKPL